MTDKASDAAGWVIEVSQPAKQPQVDVQKSSYFDVAIPDALKAAAAATKAFTKDGPGSASARHVRALSAAEVEALKLKSGEVKPA